MRQQEDIGIEILLNNVFTASSSCLHPPKLRWSSEPIYLTNCHLILYWVRFTPHRLGHHHWKEKQPPVSTQDFREQTAFPRHFLPGKLNSSSSPLAHYQFQQTPALLSQRKPCTEDQPNDPTTYCRHLSPGAIYMLAKGFSACLKQNAKVAFYKTLRNSPGSSALVFSCLPILDNEGCSEPSLERWVSLRESDEQVPTHHVAMIGISKGGGVCYNCSQ